MKPDDQTPDDAQPAPDPTPEPPAQPKKNPAASMSLLQTVLEGALDPGYSREARKPSAKKNSWWRRILVFIAAVALMFLATVAVRNLRTAQASESAVHTEILTRVESQQKLVAGLLTSIEELDAQLQESRSAMGSSADQIDPAAAVGSGYGVTTGPGLRVTMEDSEALQNQGRGIVRDYDLRLFVNTLWSAGAEAIEVNGIRLGPMTTIRTAGKAILVNLEPVTSPYTISAIGNSADLHRAMTSSTSSDQLKELSAQVGFSFTSARVDELEVTSVTPQFTQVVTINEETGEDAN